MPNFYKTADSPMGHMLEELKWDSNVIGAIAMTPTAYYQKVHCQISTSLLKPHTALLTRPEKGSDRLDLANPTVPVLEDLLCVCLHNQWSYMGVTNFSCISSAWHHCMISQLGWMRTAMPDSTEAVSTVASTSVEPTTEQHPSWKTTTQLRAPATAGQLLHAFPLQI